jgi:GT2 family glycosyltransferase
MVFGMTGIDLLLHPDSNVHFVELVDVIAAALTDLGCDVALCVDGQLPEDDSRAVVVVGPHEVYPRFRDLDHDWLRSSLRRTIAIGTEQPGLPWFDVAAPYQATAAAALDISRDGANAQRRLGIEAEHFQLGYHPLLDSSARVAGGRPIDVLFLGSLTPRRSTHLARCAPTLARVTSDIRTTDVDADQRARSSGFVAGDHKRSLIASSRMLLNIHRAEPAYFEWVRALDALSNGTLLVSEHSVDFDPLVPGVHFLSVGAGDLPWVLEAALRDPDWVDALGLAGRSFVREELPLAAAAATLANLAEAVVRRQRSPDPSSVELPTPDAQPVGLFSRDRHSAAEPAPNWRERAALKRLSLDVLALRRSVASLAVGSDEPVVEEWASPSWTRVTAGISVVITVYNYARFVAEAFESVVCSDGVDVEIVVVDDASTDDSSDVVRSLMEVHSDVPVLLLRSRLNRGLPASRNLGFARTRSELVFVLDADNTVYPKGIARLRDALDADPDAAFAYGLLQRFDDSGGVGVSGAMPWNPSRLVEENYVDAMALVRKQTWNSQGGYATDAALHGWEDYDFWLGCADAGLHGAHVRQFVARYRLHPSSMLSLTDLETESAYALVRQRHPDLYRSLERTS